MDESQRCYVKLRKPILKSIVLIPFLKSSEAGKLINKWFCKKLKYQLLLRDRDKEGLGGKGES